MLLSSQKTFRSANNFPNFFPYICNKIDNMARPIKETPILFGEEARQFENQLNNKKRASKEEIDKAEEAFNAFKNISTFQL